MSDYLESLGRELDSAAARRVAGRRPRPPLAVAAATVLAAAGVALLLLSVGAPPSDERPAVVEAPAAGTLPPPPPDLRGVAVTVANGTAVDGLAQSYAARLEQSGWRVTGTTDASTSDLDRTLVVAPTEGDARAAAEALGISVASAAGGEGLGVPGRVSIVLGADVESLDAEGPVRVVAGEPPGGACLVPTTPEANKGPACGLAASMERPFGLVAIEVLRDGTWLVFGYVSEAAATVRISPSDAEIPTISKTGVPGRYFFTRMPSRPTIEMMALDAEGHSLGSVVGGAADFAPKAPVRP